MPDEPQVDQSLGALSGDEIRSAIKRGDLGLSPILDWGRNDGLDPGQFGPSSVDLRLGCYFRTPNDSSLAVIDPTGQLGKAGREREGGFDQLVRCGYGRPFVLHPGRFALAYTLEYLALPPNLMGYVIGRSSWGRLGLIIATATMVNPLFCGVITLELANVGTLPMAMYPAMRIAQLVLHPVRGSGYPPTDEKYSRQLPGAPQRLYRDRDIPWVAPRAVTRLVGVVGPSGSGKSLITQMLVERGYRHFSLAQMVRDEARERGQRSDVETLQNLGDELRRSEGLDWAARGVARQIRESAVTRAVVSGFKHPSEVEYFRRDPIFRLIAIDASFETCLEYRRQEVGIPQATTGEDYMRFRRIWYRDFESGEEAGQNVRDCIALASARFTLMKDANTTLHEFKKDVQTLLDSIDRLETGT